MTRRLGLSIVLASMILGGVSFVLGSAKDVVGTSPTVAASPTVGGPRVQAAPTLSAAEEARYATLVAASGRLDTQLYELAEAQRAGRLTEAQRREYGVEDDGRILVTVWAEPDRGDDMHAALPSYGATPAGRDGDFMSAYVPLPALPSLAQRPDVRRVDRSSPLVLLQRIR